MTWLERAKKSQEAQAQYQERLKKRRARWIKSHMGKRINLDPHRVESGLKGKVIDWKEDTGAMGVFFVIDLGAAYAKRHKDEPDNPRYRETYRRYPRGME